MQKQEEIIRYFDSVHMKEGMRSLLDNAQRSPTAQPYPPAKLSQYCTVTHKLYDHRPAFTLTPPAPRMRVLYIHGGAYYNTFDPSHWSLMGRMCRTLGAQVVTPDYPLTPVFGHKDVFSMVCQVYRDCLTDIPGGRLVVAGDSAGGGIALALCQWAAQEGLPVPARLALLSPWLDATMTAPEIPELDKKDPFLAPNIGEVTDWYRQGEDARFYQVSPLYGPVDGLPETAVYTGTRDILNADARHFKEKLDAAGLPCHFYEQEGAIHTWILFPMEEAVAARNDLLNFIAGK